jgi:hypothetical protein
MQKSHAQRSKKKSERSATPTTANEARLDELGTDPAQVGPDSGGQSGSGQELSSVAEASDESVEELVEEEQAFEAGIVDGVEDAGDHPERPVHTHGRLSDLTADPRAAENESEGNGPDIDREDIG